MMTTLNQSAGLERETGYFMARLRELAAAVQSGDPVLVYEALDDISMIARHTEFPSIRARAIAELNRHGWTGERPAGA